MKKLISCLLLVFVLAIGVLMVSAEEPDYRVVVDGPAVVSVGEEVTYTVSLRDITLEKGIISVQFYFSFNTEMFEYVSAEESTSSGLLTFVNKTQASDGIVVLNAGQSLNGDEIALKEDDLLIFEVTLKVKQQGALKSADVKVIDDDGDADSYVLDPDQQELYNGEYGTYTSVLKQQLPTPTDLSFTSGTASWSAVENADSYTVQLYKDGNKLGKEIVTDKTSYDFTSVIAENMGGIYTFAIKATSEKEAFETSAQTILDDEKGYVYQGTLATPQITATVNRISGTVNFKIVDAKNDSQLVSTYIIRIYEKNGDEVLEEITTNVFEDAVEVDGTPFVAGKSYVFTVMAMSANPANDETGTGNNNSAESAPSAAFVADKVSQLKVKNPPQLSYTEGDRLDLTSLMITVVFASGEDENVTFSNFAKYNLVTDLKNGADVTLGMDGREIKITCGSVTLSDRLVLAVKSSACQHGSTKDEHLDPSCGSAGYDRVVCSLCGITVSEEILPATGNHPFSEWIVDLEPTERYNGLRHRDCTVCDERENEVIPYEAPTTPDTSDDPIGTTDENPGITTTPSETDPLPETSAPSGGSQSDPLGGVKDIGKIFLTVLIVIVLLIVVFIILAIWLESRRNRRRRSRARTSQARGRAPQNRNHPRR